MSLIRPNFGELFRRAVTLPVGTRPDPSASSVYSSRSTLDVEEDLDDTSAGIDPRRSDPASPREGQVWLRIDKVPVEIRAYAGVQTYAVALAAVEAEPHTPLYPSATLHPSAALYPAGFENDEPRPRYPRANLHPPFYPRRY